MRSTSGLRVMCLRVWLTLAGSLVTPTLSTVHCVTEGPQFSLRVTPPTPTQVSHHCYITACEYRDAQIVELCLYI